MRGSGTSGAPLPWDGSVQYNTVRYGGSGGPE